jgi:uncharacterized protein YaiI (UPF0178 family)
MLIWVDADACPNTIKEILFRAAVRTQVVVILVANQFIRVPSSEFIKALRVPQGFDMADNEILKKMHSEDLVITADIPLANAVIEKGGTALNPRGTLYTKNNVKQCLSIRDFHEHLRSCGNITRGPALLSQKEVRDFSNALDQFLTARSR